MSDCPDDGGDLIEGLDEVVGLGDERVAGFGLPLVERDVATA